MKPHFEVISCLGKSIRISEERWRLITRRKHPEIYRKEDEVQAALKDADAVRVSQGDVEVFLYYKRLGKYHLCIVCRHLNGDGFIITSYLTDRLKEGHEIWRK
jgi:hypothetical protein